MKGSKNKFKDKVKPYIYVSPLLISITILSLLPILYTVYIGFTNYNLNHMNDYKFVGFKNFTDILTGNLQPIFFPVFGWTLVFATLSALGSYAIGLIFAIVLSNENIKERNIYKAILIIPWAIPATVALMTWQGLLNEQYGGVNVLLTKLHIINSGIPWMTNVFWARTGIIMVNLWLGFPWMMNICIGALSAIDNTFYEAAEIDGATRFQKFIKITLPSITASSLPLIISSFAFNFNNLGAAYLILGGDPPRVSSQFAGYTDILVSTGYKLTQQFYRYDLSGAFSVLIFLIIGTISFINMKKSGSFKEVD